MLASLKHRELLSEDRLVKLANLLVNKTQEAMYCLYLLSTFFLFYTLLIRNKLAWSA